MHICRFPCQRDCICTCGNQSNARRKVSRHAILLIRLLPHHPGNFENLSVVLIIFLISMTKQWTHNCLREESYSGSQFEGITVPLGGEVTLAGRWQEDPLGSQGSLPCHISVWQEAVTGINLNGQPRWPTYCTEVPPPKWSITFPNRTTFKGSSAEVGACGEYFPFKPQ